MRSDWQRSLNKFNVGKKLFPEWGNKEKVKVEFKDGTGWIPSCADLYRILKPMGECEEERFPQSEGYEGRRMLLRFLRDTLMTDFPFEVLANEYKIPERE